MEEPEIYFNGHGISTIIWDWNGTLLNDVKCSIKSKNMLLKKRDMPLINKKKYLEIFTFPVKDYYQQLGFNFDKEPFDILAQEYIKYYLSNAKKCCLHKGVNKILQIFKNEEIMQYILSAQKQNTLIEQVRQKNILKYFKAIVGPNNIYAYDKAGIGLLFFQKMGLNPLNTLLIGDTIHDWETARTLNCHCILIANGHQSYDRLIKTGAVVIKNLYGLLNYKNQGNTVTYL